MRYPVALLAFAIATTVLAGSSRQAVAAITVDTQFTFTGTCSDCAGVGVGTLTVANYTPGTSFSNAEFVDFTYTSNIYPASSPFEVTATGLQSFVGSIGPSLPGPFSVSIDGVGSNVFFSEQSSNASGGSFWCLGNSCLADYGPVHSWSAAAPVATPVPEPVSSALFATGLIGLGIVRARRR